MQEYIQFFQQNTILCIIWIALFVAVIVMTFKAKTAGYKVITASEVTHLINRENGVVVDVRSRDEFRQGHITDSLHILPSEIKEGSYPQLEKHKTDPIIVVCKTGQTAQESANLLVKEGFTNVNLLKSGLLSWSEANLPLVRGKK